MYSSLKCLMHTRTTFMSPILSRRRALIHACLSSVGCVGILNTGTWSRMTRVVTLAAWS